MKVQEKQKAIVLRKRGISMGEIAKQLGVAKSSISYWTRDIKLTSAQRAKLNANGHSVDAIEKRRIARLANTEKKRREIMDKAIEEIPTLLQNPLWSIGIALYWGEGGKTQGIPRLSNSDPAVIKTMMRFFREVCKVPEGKFRGHVHTFSHLNTEKAEQYWSSVSKVSREQFFKTYVKQSSASKRKRDTLPNGTYQVYVMDSVLFYRIKGWMEGLKDSEHF